MSDMRKRFNVSFDLQAARHREAARLLDEQPVGQRTEFIVDCILLYDRSVKLEKIVRTAIQEELRHFTDCQVPSDPPAFAAVLQLDEANLSDVPDSLLHAMDDP